MPELEEDWPSLPDGPAWTWWLLAFLPLSQELKVGILPCNFRYTDCRKSILIFLFLFFLCLVISSLVLSFSIFLYFFPCFFCTFFYVVPCPSLSENIIYNNFLDTFLKIFNASFPVKKTQSKQCDKKWLTTGIRTSCNNKGKLYLSYKENNNPKLKKHYKEYCKLLTKVIILAKKNHITILN